MFLLTGLESSKLVLRSHSTLSQTPSHGIRLHCGPLPCAKTVASLCVRAPGRKRMTSCAGRHPRTTASWKWRPAPSTQTLSARTAWAHLPSASRDLSSPALIQMLPRGYYDKPAAPRVQKVQNRGRESSSLQSIKIDCKSGNDSTQNTELIRSWMLLKGTMILHVWFTVLVIESTVEAAVKESVAVQQALRQVSVHLVQTVL